MAIYEAKSQIKKQNNNNKFKKIRLAILLTILICALSILTIQTCAPTIFYNLGQNAYKNEKYKDAAQYFKLSYSLNPQSIRTAYYWASSMSKLQLIYPYQKDLYRISQLDDDSAADMLASSTLQSFKVNLLMKVGGNYIESALYNDQVLHWNTNTIPLKYYIDYTTSVPKYYTDMINKAFKQWEEKTNSLVQFQQTKNQDEANIVLFFKDIDNSLITKEGRVEYNVGEATPVIENNLLKQMKIQIIAQNNLRQYFTSKEIDTVAKHEIGHALGIWGHSKNINDIMYYSASEEFGFLGASEKEISADDVNTLRLLYFMAPNITNKKISSDEEKYYLFAPVVTSRFENNNNFYLQKCLANTIKTPDDVNVWIQLANAYGDNKNYEKSIETLEKAVDLTDDPENLAVIYYNMANNALNNDQPNEAMQYASKAQFIHKDYDTKSLVAYIKYKQGNYDAAKSDLKNLLSERPEDIDNSLTLANVYIKQKKYWAARSTIKELIKNNPDAKNDDRLSYYKVYVLF